MFFLEKDYSKNPIIEVHDGAAKDMIRLNIESCICGRALVIWLTIEEARILINDISEEIKRRRI